MKALVSPTLVGYLSTGGGAFYLSSLGPLFYGGDISSRGEVSEEKNERTFTTLLCNKR